MTGSVDVGGVPLRRPRHPLRPRDWGIAARSAIVSAIAVFIALTVAAVGLLTLLNYLLLSAVDDAAGARVADITAVLEADGPGDVDEDLLTTDQRVTAVQIIDADGRVLRRSSGAPSTPLAAAGTFGPEPTIGLPDEMSPRDDMRLAGRTINTPTANYVVIVGGGSEPVEATVRTVAMLLAALVPVVTAVAAFVSHRLVKRSLRSVDAIRSRVAAISTSDLSGRVPVPDGRDEIASLAVTMNAMLDRVEIGHRAQQQFVGDASHELRSPLTTILSALEVVESHPHLLSHELASDTLLPEAKRMHALVEDLLLLARADEKGLALRHDDVHLDELVTAEAVRVRRHSAPAIHTDVHPARVSGDGAALTRVFGNLLDNAARHAGSRIDIVVRTGDGQAVVTICDDGPGIPQSQRERIFDRFVRLDGDRSRFSGGAGLGLAIVAEIVSAHDGAVVVDEPPGGGTRVTVTLPSGQ